MCGIVGVASSQKIVREQFLVVRNNLLDHRGPDDSGVWWSKNAQVGLGHRRLSIIDLSNDGHQPMHLGSIGL